MPLQSLKWQQGYRLNGLTLEELTPDALVRIYGGLAPTSNGSGHWKDYITSASLGALTFGCCFFIFIHHFQTGFLVQKARVIKNAETKGYANLKILGDPSALNISVHKEFYHYNEYESYLCEDPTKAGAIKEAVKQHNIRGIEAFFENASSVEQSKFLQDAGFLKINSAGGTALTEHDLSEAKKAYFDADVVNIKYDISSRLSRINHSLKSVFHRKHRVFLGLFIGTGMWLGFYFCLMGNWADEKLKEWGGH